MLSLARRSIVTLLFLGGFGLLVALLAARVGTWARPWPLELLDTFALWAFLPFLGVAGAALLLWSRALALLALAALLFFLQQFGPQLASLVTPTGRSALAAPAAPAEGTRLRVLTFNLHSPSYYPGALAAVIRETNPDVVVLQEVTASFAAAFDRAMAAEYPFSVTAGLDTAHEGSGTWSRLPLLDGDVVQLSADGNVLHRARVLTPQGTIWLYNVHLMSPIGGGLPDGRRRGWLDAVRRLDDGHRDAELARLAAQTAALDAPFVLAGDFNSAAGSRPYRAFPSTWHDAFTAAGRGFGHTFPAPSHERVGRSRLVIPFPLLRIDYVLASRELRALDAWTVNVGSSDHLAVVADLELPAAR